MKRLASIGLVLLLVLAVGSVAIAAPDYTQIDEDHELNEHDSITEFDETGETKADFLYPNMDVTIGTDKDSVGLESGVIDFSPGTEYLRLDYNEDRERVVRLYLSDEYFSPYDDTLQPIEGDAEADIVPVRDRSYTSVKVHLSGDADTYVYEVSRLNGRAQDVTNWQFDRFSPFEGDEDDYIPEEEEWQFVDSDDIDESYRIELENPDEYRVQYLQGEDDWSTVPESEDDSEPYYIHNPDGEDTIYVMATDTSDTPQLRWKASTGVTDVVDDGVDEVEDIGRNIIEDILRFNPF